MLQPSEYFKTTLSPHVTTLFTTRRGGVSQGPWEGLNLSASGGDDPHSVAHNRELVSTTIGAPLFGMNQVHGAEVAVVDAQARDLVPPTADALVTRDPNIGLAVLVADCVPVLLADEKAGVAAAAHAGRLGVIEGIVPATLKKMVELGARANQVRAAIGPAICGSCYEVPEKMRAAFATEFPGAVGQTSWDTPSLDLPGAVAHQLQTGGVEEVQNLQICTFEDQRTYSYRRNRETGRQAGVIRLQK